MYPVFADVFAGPTDEGFRTMKAYVEPIQKASDFVKNITTSSTANKGTGETGGGGGRDVPNRMAGRRDANPNRGFTRTKYGKAYRRGGIASLWQR